MHWADRIAKEIIDSGQYKPYWIDDMFTPSGFAHIGSLRGPLVHDLAYKALVFRGVDVKSTFVFNDFDPIDGLAPDLVPSFSKFLGFPLKTAPSPDGKKESNFADYFASDFKDVLGNLGVHPEFFSSWDMYHEGRFDEVIREALDHAEDIQDIYQRVSGSQKREQGWLPLQVICESCGKLGTTRVHDWNGETVAYKCEPRLVKWAEGCGYEGRISPFGGNGKLPWKVDWPAHWKVIGVTIEGAGKDHSSAGGSRDIARELCKTVFNYPEPFNFAYEFFLLGGRKMGSSKGVGLRARELINILPRPIARFLFARTDYRQTIEFDPVSSMAIPDLFDEYNRCWRAYNRGEDKDLARTFELSQIEILPPKNAKLFIPRFRDIANFIELGIDVFAKAQDLKGTRLTDFETELVEERIRVAQVWIDTYAPDEYRYKMTGDLPETAKKLTKDQKLFLERAVGLVEKSNNPDDLQAELYNLAKVRKISAKDAFRAIYQVFMGKDHGPKAGWFLLQYPRDKVIKRLQEASK